MHTIRGKFRMFLRHRYMFYIDTLPHRGSLLILPFTQPGNCVEQRDGLLAQVNCFYFLLDYKVCDLNRNFDTLHADAFDLLLCI